MALRLTRRRILAGILATTAAALLFLPLCALAFDCGCTWAFLGGATHCNMHAPQPPHCPLCVGPRIYGLAFTAVLWTALFVPLDRVLRQR